MPLPILRRLSFVIGENWHVRAVRSRQAATREKPALVQELQIPRFAITYFPASSSPRYFSIAFELGGAPRHVSYILARSSVLPRDNTILRKRSPLARVNPPCSLNHS